MQVIQGHRHAPEKARPGGDRKKRTIRNRDAADGYLFFYLIAKLFQLITKRDGMGYGDFKLLAAIGAWLGWQLLPLVIFSSAVIVKNNVTQMLTI